jgi:16S rRNA (adenine1518-N6/adenine1519-N6)-dimethyltransferase
MAQPGDKDYGVLTLLVQLDFECRKSSSFKIPASCFFPEPDVDSACVCLLRRAQTPLSAEQREAFVRIVKRAFSQRRKMMMKLLREDWPASKLESVFAALKIPPQVRAETLSLEQFVSLTRKLSEHE